MAPVKRHVNETDFKFKDISHALKHGNIAAVREFNINETMVWKWRKQEDDLSQVKKKDLKEFPREQNEMATVRGQKLNSGLLNREQQVKSISTLSIRHWPRRRKDGVIIKAHPKDWIEDKWVAERGWWLFHKSQSLLISDSKGAHLTDTTKTQMKL